MCIGQSATECRTEADIGKALLGLRGQQQSVAGSLCTALAWGPWYRTMRPALPGTTLALRTLLPRWPESGDGLRPVRPCGQASIASQAVSHVDGRHVSAGHLCTCSPVTLTDRRSPGKGRNMAVRVYDTCYRCALTPKCTPPSAPAARPFEPPPAVANTTDRRRAPSNVGPLCHTVPAKKTSLRHALTFQRDAAPAMCAPMHGHPAHDNGTQRSVPPHVLQRSRSTDKPYTQYTHPPVP